MEERKKIDSFKNRISMAMAIAILIFPYSIFLGVQARRAAD
jgi:hypothetical protein